jgi:putative transposase
VNLRRAWIVNVHRISIRRQCKLLGLHRWNVYYQPAESPSENFRYMRLIDEQYLRTPFFGSRRMAIWLSEKEGRDINRKRVQALMRIMNLRGMAPGPSTSRRNPQHKVYPYLLRDLEITRANQVWAADITYLPMEHGFGYLVAIIDWHTRMVLAWRISNSLDTRFCVDALEEALSRWGAPEIFNTDQGTQFTAEAWINVLTANAVRISMDGKGRTLADREIRGGLFARVQPPERSQRSSGEVLRLLQRRAPSPITGLAPTVGGLLRITGRTKCCFLTSGVKLEC